jgi:hypothetical protein
MLATVIKNTILIALFVLIGHLLLINYNDNNKSISQIWKESNKFLNIRNYGFPPVTTTEDLKTNTNTNTASPSPAAVSKTAEVTTNTPNPNLEVKELYDFVYDDDSNNKEALSKMFESSLLKKEDMVCDNSTVRCPNMEEDGEDPKSEMKKFCLNEVDMFLAKRKKDIKKDSTHMSSSLNDHQLQDYTTKGNHPIILEYHNDKTIASSSGEPHSLKPFESFSSHFMSI